MTAARQHMQRLAFKLALARLHQHGPQVALPVGDPDERHYLAWMAMPRKELTQRKLSLSSSSRE